METNEDKMGWNCPDSIADLYLQKCKLFVSNDVEFNIFRQDKDYGKILEGGEYIVGTDGINRINRRPEYHELVFSNLEKFKENDIYGGPYIKNYGIYGDISPNTLNYIADIINIKYLVKDTLVNRIVEVGGGFGAMCKIFSTLFSFNEYILVDLPEVLELCKKYLSNFPELNGKVSYISCNDVSSISNIGDVDLFISTAAMAECYEEAQLRYSSIIKRSKFAYILYNTLHLPELNLIYQKLIAMMDTFATYELENLYWGGVIIYMKSK